jgi:predicted amidophosphoribosyltransferase
VKRTHSQVGLTKTQRQENLQGAFKVPPEARARLADKRVLLVDDVLTTGSTANAAARALLRGGAKAVDVLALRESCRRRLRGHIEGPPTEPA